MCASFPGGTTCLCLILFVMASQFASKSLQTLKTPPILQDEESYLEWKEDLLVLELFTYLEKKKRGPAVYLTLSGHAHDCVRDLELVEIGGEDGVKKIVAKLDKVFLKDKDTQTFVAFETFYNYRRSSGVSITDFLVEFEYLCHRLGKQEITLPQGVWAFLLLKASNISTENERLARATCQGLSYENMKACILKIFGDPASDNGGSEAPSIKSEPVLKTEHEDALQSSWRGGWQSRGRNRGSRGRGYGGGWSNMDTSRGMVGSKSYSDPANGQRSNPVGKDGRVLKCFRCGSDKHFTRYCN